MCPWLTSGFDAYYVTKLQRMKVATFIHPRSYLYASGKKAKKGKGQH